VTVRDAVNLAVTELEGARAKHHAFNSGHEGYAVIREELDELWDAIKRQKGYNVYSGPASHEAVQVAAMALRFLVDLCDAEGTRAYIDGRRQAKSA
jgi:hypothetical protein